MSAINVPHVQMLRIPVLDRPAQAGKPDGVEDEYQVVGFREVPVEGGRKGEALRIVDVAGDSMVDIGIRDGYWVLFSLNPHVEYGDLCVVRTPGGLVVKFWLPENDGKVVLGNANKSFVDRTWRASDVSVMGPVRSFGASEVPKHPDAVSPLSRFLTIDEPEEKGAKVLRFLKPIGSDEDDDIPF